MGKFLTYGIWWFFLFWLPKYLEDTQKQNNFSKKKLDELTAPKFNNYLIKE
jgi:hypothetical protein